MTYTPEDPPELEIPYNGALTLSRYDDGDWYRIDRRDHDDRSWEEKEGHVNYYCLSRRIDPRTTVEGTASEMVDLAQAILNRSCNISNRCAVQVVGDRVRLWSPRNSNDVVGSVPLAVADDLANEILSTLIHLSKSNP